MEACAPDWSGLLPELLSKIAEMVFVDDFSAFQCVCSSWRAAAAAVQNRPTAIGSPLVMLDGRKYRNFYSPLRRKVCIRIALPEANRKRCIPAGFGWIVTVTQSEEAALLNPFSRALTSLPSHRYFSATRIRAVLSANPDSNNFVLFMLIDIYQVMFWSPGDENWTMFASSEWVFNIFYSGKRLYAITYGGDLQILVDGTKTEVLVSGNLRSMIPGVALNRSWLIESLEDNGLILLVRYEKRFDQLDSGEYFYRLFRIDVMKREWKEVRDLDGDAVFAGDNYTGVAVPASSSGAMPDFIYFGYNVGDIGVHDFMNSCGIKPIETYFGSHGFGSYLSLKTPETLSYEGPINDAVSRFTLNCRVWF